MIWNNNPLLSIFLGSLEGVYLLKEKNTDSMLSFKLVLGLRCLVFRNILQVRYITVTYINLSFLTNILKKSTDLNDIDLI